jgi:two-component system NtrC family sensor kinase
MDDHSTLASVRFNGKEPIGRAVKHAPDSVALGRADRLANVGQLAAGLAHEMNTPLGSISAHAEESLELVEHIRDGRIPKEKLDDLRGRLLAIMRQANRCSHIATRLLQFAQPARSLGATCRAEQVIEQVVDLFTAPARGKDVRLEHFLAGDLPDAPLSAADLEQLLVNLVQNSLDACEPGAQIIVEVKQHERQIQVVVSDTGCGIPRATLNRVFDPFFTTKPVGRGTGLGLSVCLGIVRSIHGAIEVESAPQQGTRVTVTLPLAGAVAGDARAREGAPPLAVNTPRAAAPEAGEVP